MIQFIDSTHSANKLSVELQRVIRKAQDSNFANSFKNTEEFLSEIFKQLRIQLKVVNIEDSKSVTEFADKSFGDFVRFFILLLEKNNYPSQSTQRIAISLASRAMLLRAFDNPDAIIHFIKYKLMKIIDSFPRTASDIECGRNKGDVIDPFILSATQFLLYEGDFDAAITATVSHKALMIIEGLIGHLHEDVLGMMRGNVRIPEPRGEDQEKFDYLTNPFPGADVIQPPMSHDDCFKIHQIKSKTGSAKGGDGKRLGDQLQFLSEEYQADIFYDALIGNTLIGHRSKTGVEKAAPNVRVVVGQTAFYFLTGSKHGASLLLRLYNEAFTSAANESGYSIVEISKGITECFRARAEELGEDFLDSILERSTCGIDADQDSYIFNSKKRSRR